MRFIIIGSRSSLANEVGNWLSSHGHEVNEVDFCEFKEHQGLLIHADAFVNLERKSSNSKDVDIKTEQLRNIENSIEAIITARRMGSNLYVDLGSYE